MGMGKDLYGGGDTLKNGIIDIEGKSIDNF
jgi:hypothetical protein